MITRWKPDWIWPIWCKVPLMPLKKMEETCSVCLSILNKYFITLRADARIECEWSTDSICGLSLSLSLGLRGPMELCQTRAPCAIRVWIEKIYALNGIAANSCLYAQEQTKGMFDCVWVSDGKTYSFVYLRTSDRNHSKVLSLAFGSNDQMQDVIKHLSANVTFYACDHRLYLYNTV